MFKRWIGSASRRGGKKKTGRAAQEAGRALEIRVRDMYVALGKWRVREDVKLKDSFGNNSQLDVGYGLFFTTYVECKNYGSKSVGLEDVAKFKEVLQLNNVPLSRGVFITTSTFSPRATTIGIRCIDGEQLQRLEKRAYRRRWKVRLLKVLGALMAGAFLFVDEDSKWVRYMNNALRVRETKRVLEEKTKQATVRLHEATVKGAQHTDKARAAASAKVHQASTKAKDAANSARVSAQRSVQDSARAKYDQVRDRAVRRGKDLRRWAEEQVGRR
jgi:hypothetical protein